MNYLCDTNVISEIYKPRPNVSLLKWLRGIDPTQLYLSVITIGEIRRGIEMKRLRYPDATLRLEQSLAEVERLYAGRIWIFDHKAAHVWGRMTARPSHHLVDMQIAAIAQANGAALVTRNVKDFEGMGIGIVNPFEV